MYATVSERYDSKIDEFALRHETRFSRFSEFPRQTTAHLLSAGVDALRAESRIDVSIFARGFPFFSLACAFSPLRRRGR